MLTTLAQAIMAEVHDLNIEPKVVVLPVLSGARAWNTTPQQQPQTVTINVPPSAPAQPQPDPRITAALLGQEIRIRGGLR